MRLRIPLKSFEFELFSEGIVTNLASFGSNTKSWFKGSNTLSPNISNFAKFMSSLIPETVKYNNIKIGIAKDRTLSKSFCDCDIFRDFKVGTIKF